MKRQQTHHWWQVFAACVFVVVAVMSGVTWLVLHLEHETYQNQAIAKKQEALRLALWRMDAWMAPRIGREAGRPWFEYEPYYSSAANYTRMLNPVQYGEVLTPSVLLTFDSPYFPLHFQIDETGEVTSPQVPTGNLRDLAEATLLEDGWVTRKQVLLDEVRSLVATTDVRAACRQMESAFSNTASSEDNADVEAFFGLDAPSESQTDTYSLDNEKQNWVELQQRASQTLDLQQEANIPLQMKQQADTRSSGFVGHIESETASLGVTIDTNNSAVGFSGVLVPLWIELPSADQSSTSNRQLIFIRRIQIGGKERFQGILADFSILKQELLNQASDLLPRLTIEPHSAALPPAESTSAWALSTVPAVVESDFLPTISMPLMSPARLMMLLMWLGVAIAIGATAMTLRSTIDFANRRNRFASAVTHELRTPLTTFQMYSEMLATGMIKDPEKMQIYHETLHHESTRLGTIVENVLAYSQIEDGHADNRREVVTMTELMQRLSAAIAPRIEKSNCEMVMETVRDHSDDDGALESLRVNVDAITTIVLNLVDNACKYGCYEKSVDHDVDENAANIVTLRLTLLNDRKTLRCEVCDDGPGVEDDIAKRIFEPFERGHIPPGSSKPGVGIGLALARDLAKAMGGTLTLRHNRKDQIGACFVLEVDRSIN